jgi:hypothetical protein
MSKPSQSISPQLVPPQSYPEYLHSGLYPSLCAHNTNTTYTSLLHSIAGHVAFLTYDMSMSVDNFFEDKWCPKLIRPVIMRLQTV